MRVVSPRLYLFQEEERRVFSIPRGKTDSLKRGLGIGIGGALTDQIARVFGTVVKNCHSS